MAVGQVKTTEELFGQVFSTEELFRPTFTTEELEAKQREIIDRAKQEAERWKWENEPKKWGSEFWYEFGQGLKTERWFTKKYWKKTGLNLLRQTADMMASENVTPIGKQRQLIQKGIQAYRAIVGERKLSSPIQEATGQVRSAFDFVTFIPKTLVGLVTDPVATIQERPLDILMLVGATAGTKAYNKIKASAKANKGWVTSGDIIRPMLRLDSLHPDLARILQRVPADFEIEFPVKGALEIVKTKKGGIMPFFKHHWEGIKSDIARMGDLPDRPLKFGRTVGLRVPIRVFEQYPWLKRIGYNEWRIGDFKAFTETNKTIKQIRAWKKNIPYKSQERVGVYAMYQQVGGAEIMGEMIAKAKKAGKNWRKFELPELNQVEMRYYQWGRKLFDDYLVRINKGRALAGTKPIGKVIDYTTWMRNISELLDVGVDIMKADKAMVEMHLNDIALSFSKSRSSKVLKTGVETHYGKLLENYSRQALEHIHLTPTIAKMRTLLEPFGEGKTEWNIKKVAPNLATWLEEWTDTIAGQKRMLPKGRSKVFVQLANKLNRNIGMAVLSYNVRSALIQPSAFKLSYVYLGEKFLLQGLLKNLKKIDRDFALANSKHLALRKSSYIMEARAITELGQKLYKSRTAQALATSKQGFAQAGMFPLQWLDFQTAQATWLGAYDKGIQKYGYGHKRAVTYADDVIVKTQASARPGDIAPIQRTPYGRLLTLFQTFVINEWDFLTHDVMGYKRGYDITKMRNRSHDIARFVLASAVVNAVYEGVLKLRSPYPAPEWAFMRGMQEGEPAYKIAGAMVRETAEQLPIIGGTIRWSTPYRTALPAFIQAGLIDPYQMINRFLEKPSITTDQAEWIGKMLGIGGTSQGMKYWRRRKKGQSHIEAIIGVRSEEKGKKKPKW